MKSTTFNEVWNKIVNNAGEVFKTKTGLEFTYSINGELLLPSVTDYKISKNDFKKAYAMLPIDGPGKIRDIVRGPSYVWAILNDKRVLG